MKSLRSHSPRGKAFTLIELLMVLVVVSILIAFIAIAVTRSQERAKRAKCEGLLRQFHLMVRMYADDNDGYVAEYSHFSQQMEMICPSDNRETRYRSYDGSPYIFGSRRQRLNEAGPQDWMLTEYEPFHDPASKPSKRRRGAWIGRFNLLEADGELRWTKLVQ